MSLEGLGDFGEGAFSGGSMAGKVSGNNPYAIAGGALFGGVTSYFGAAPERRMERKANRLSIAGMEQDLELGEMSVSKARRAEKEDREAKKRKETFGRLLGEYFQRKQGVK